MANLRVNKITTGVGSYNGSIYATGTSSYLFTTVTAPGTDDFTIECYINTDQASGSNQDGIFAINGSTGGFQSTTTNQIRFTLGRAGGGGQNGGLEVNINGTAVDCGSNDIIQEGTWHHVAVTRASGTVKIWVDGVEKGSGTAAGDVTGTTFITGYYDGLYTFQGFMSNFRYRKGTAHYTTTFTAPTKPLERTSDTELIFAQSPHNPSNGFSSAIHGGITDIMQVIGHVTANQSSPTQLSDTSGVGVVYDGPIKHNTQGYMYFPTGRTEEKGRGRAVIMGGVESPNPYMTRMDFITIQTTGNSLLFGDLSFGSRDAAGAVSSTIRAVYGGGMGPSSEAATNSMSFVTIATQGNGTDYGDLTAAKRQGEGCSNGVRGIFMGGENDSPSPGTYNNVIDFCTIASIGNASDFGDLTAARDGGGVCSSPIRGVCGGGYDSGNSDVIDFVTIATTGNATDFGNLTTARTGATGCASATRGLFMGGRVAPNNKDEIDFITIASAGNASDFGDLQQERIQASATASQTRGVHIGGNPGSSPYNFTNMQFVTIASTGNASDFGETHAARSRRTASDCHGGLS